MPRRSGSLRTAPGARRAALRPARGDAVAMQPEQTSTPSATRAWWHEVSWPARVAFVCGIPVAFGLVIWEAVFDDSLGPEHPLGIGRLSLRLGCFFVCGVC